MSSRAYIETIRVYQELGKDYVRAIENLSPKELLRFASLLPRRGKILDVGCAGGRDSKRFAAKGFSVVGIDVVPEFLKEARKAVPKAKFMKMDVHHLKFPKNYFDAIWANAVLLHFSKSEVPKILKKLFQVLKPGGKIHVGVKLGKGIKYESDILVSGKKRMFNYFEKIELKRYLEKSGFQLFSLMTVPDMRRKNTKWIKAWAAKT